MAYRRITTDEQNLVKLLLGTLKNENATFHCSDDVEEIDREGSLKFRHGNVAGKNEQQKFPVEAQAKDADGTWIHALLFLVNDDVDELEFYKDDSSGIVRKPSSRDWEIIDLS